MMHMSIRNALLAVSLVLVAGPGLAGDDPPDASAGDITEQDRQRYLEQEMAREAVRSNPDYGRYDRADLNRSRRAFCQRLATRPGPRWAVGGYARDHRRHLRRVDDYRGYGVRPPPYGSQWMCADSGDMLLVVGSSGLISDMIPYEVPYDH